MSRHRIIKNIDLDHELDDFDGGEDYDYDGGDAADGEELSEEDQAHMIQGTIDVRELLPTTASHITDKQIQEALWHYYYDVEKSVSYLMNTFVAVPPKTKKKAAERKNQGGSDLFGTFEETDRVVGDENSGMLGDHCFEYSSISPCSKPFSFADFFKDTPWLNIPLERHAVFIAPLYPRGGLLGGASNGGPKMSKLQALAAARKKMAQQQKSGAASGLEKATSSLSLDQGGQQMETGEESTMKPSKIAPSISVQSSRGFPLRKRKNSNPHENTSPAPLVGKMPEKSSPDIGTKMPPVNQAEPSPFACTMFGNATQIPRHVLDEIFTLPYVATATTTSTDPFAGPSPDDVVIAAQSKATSKGGKGLPKTSGQKKADQIANGVEALKIDGTPRATSKNLDVLAEFKKLKAKNSANFVVIGHVDAGKSTLMGRLLYDLKVVDQRTIDRYRKEAEKLGKSSFALAWVLDQGTEERSRGITIDIATNRFETEKTAFTILDAPGHRDFIPNMIAGASQADFAVLVIDSSTGSFEAGLRGQTKEHALLVRSLGVQRIIIAVNKLDTVKWSKDRFDEISQQVSAFLTSAGFQAKNISFVPCSGLQGDNIAQRSTEPTASWYSGPTLVEELDKSEPIARALNKPLRITIGDIFRGGVQNPLSVSGRIESGTLQTGDALLAQPSGQKCFIKALEIDNASVDWAVAGQNTTVHLSDIDPIHLKIGDVLCMPSSPIQNVKNFSAKVLAFEFLTPMQVDVHRGRLHTAGKITEIVAVLDKGSGAVVGKKKPRIVKPGQVARVTVELDSAVPLEAPARVVLRSGGETVAAGLLE